MDVNDGGRIAERASFELSKATVEWTLFASIIVPGMPSEIEMLPERIPSNAGKTPPRPPENATAPPSPVRAPPRKSVASDVSTIPAVNARDDASSWA